MYGGLQETYVHISSIWDAFSTEFIWVILCGKHYLPLFYEIPGANSLIFSISLEKNRKLTG